MASYTTLLEAYDIAGLPYERALTRLGFAHCCLAQHQWDVAQAANAVTLQLARGHRMAIVEADAWELEVDLARRRQDEQRVQQASAAASRLRHEVGYHGPGRP